MLNENGTGRITLLTELWEFGSSMSKTVTQLLLRNPQQNIETNKSYFIEFTHQARDKNTWQYFILSIGIVTWHPIKVLSKYNIILLNFGPNRNRSERKRRETE